VIAMHQICSELECLNRCLSLEKCVSFNFGLKTLGSRHPCELNSVTRALSGQALKIRKGFSYYEPIPFPQQVSFVWHKYFAFALKSLGDFNGGVSTRFSIPSELLASCFLLFFN